MCRFFDVPGWVRLAPKFRGRLAKAMVMVTCVGGEHSSIILKRLHGRPPQNGRETGARPFAARSAGKRVVTPLTCYHVLILESV